MLGPLFAVACFPEITFDDRAPGADAGDDRTLTSDAPVEGGGADADADGIAAADAADVNAADAADATVDARIDAPSDARDAPPSTAGMVLLAVDGGAFDFEPPTSGDPRFDPWVTARLTRSFYLDDAEVTVERFRAWHAAGRPVPCDDCTLDPGGPFAQRMVWRAQWTARAKDTSYVSCGNTTFRTDGGNATLPMNCMNWYQAVAFCAFDDGKRLPTQTEWAYAATGRGDRRKYAWGDDEPDCGHALLDLERAPDGAATFCGFPRPVKSTPFGRSPEGAWDLIGSLWEWTWDRAEYADGGYYPLVADGATNYPGPDRSDAAGDLGVLRGSYYAHNFVSSYSKIGWASDYGVVGHGFRCARTAP
jgi:formylglycine-generating enzyme required for sulfatase activity